MTRLASSSADVIRRPEQPGTGPVDHSRRDGGADDGGEGFAVGPLGARQVRLQILTLEAGAGVTAAELLELDIAPSAGGCVNVDQVARRSPVGETFVPITSSSARTGP